MRDNPVFAHDETVPPGQIGHPGRGADFLRRQSMFLTGNYLVKLPLKLWRGLFRRVVRMAATICLITFVAMLAMATGTLKPDAQIAASARASLLANPIRIGSLTLSFSPDDAAAGQSPFVALKLVIPSVDVADDGDGAHHNLLRQKLVELSLRVVDAEEKTPGRGTNSVLPEDAALDDLPGDIVKRASTGGVASAVPSGSGMLTAPRLDFHQSEAGEEVSLLLADVALHYRVTDSIGMPPTLVDRAAQIGRFLGLPPLRAKWSSAGIF